METESGRDGGPATSIINVCGAALGMAVGFAAIFISTNGVFIPAVLRDFHWGRAQAAQSYAASMLGLALVSPLIGILMDRFGVRKVCSSQRWSLPSQWRAWVCRTATRYGGSVSR